ncbi:polysaccharide pyruvyl transferase family protein [Aeromicrobium ginsengisoli]|uniref:Polysaccharide pyruvyl transferase family protein n=1 Tax=Aeromicrobium ginsengisoli TaxID=363867 RepID=A0A5M4FD63_9ACTN|nr:polysaccharide pyruvyl transferase family protein [Aeromicrobium ginsengisoli]KAA1397148.1 polysaccharide pyruvyl transferase family protein [Aeromicrobium ginsengisoli]
MTRLLVRSGKDPFTPVVAESTLTQDVFNSNSGNYLFQHSVWKALSTDSAELVSNGTLSERVPPEPRDARRINDEFDHFVIPMANAFRPEFAPRLDRLSELLEDLTIPVTVVGIGAQAAHGQGVESLEPIADTVKKFVGLVLDRSASIGVRGEFTRSYLLGLGFPESSVEVIGCPSLFLHGRDFRVDKLVDSISIDSPLALNLTPEVAGIGAFATAQAARHPNLTYIGQDAHDLRMLLWGTPFPHVHDPLVPVHLDHPLYQSDRIRLFLDTWTWYDFLATQDFAYGTRFHGNVAALLGRTPALLLAHDSRTLELAEYHRMPYTLMPEFTSELKAEDLYESTDMAEFNAALPEGFDRYTAFLERNGLEHIWTEGNGTGDFDERLAAATFPRPVHPLIASDGHEVASRLKWLRDGMVLDITRHPQAYEHPFPHPPWSGAGSRHARIQTTTAEKLATQKRQIDELYARLERVERNSPRGLTKRLIRYVQQLVRRRR